MNRIRVGVFLWIFLTLGCASQDPNYETQMFLPQSDINSQAPGSAFNNMMIDKPIPSRPNWKPMEFYYKHCSSMNSKSYFSKTEYDCNDPY